MKVRCIDVLVRPCVAVLVLVPIGVHGLSASEPTVAAHQVAQVSDKSEQRSAEELAESQSEPKPNPEPLEYEFAAPKMITAGGEPIRVESPGYACPSLFDFDKDGSEDLIVGQFAGGKMKWYRNLSSPGEMPEYESGKWIMSGDEPAIVPGVS